jgi:hypothetical protein
MPEHDDIDEVRTEEERRGKRPSNIAEKKYKHTRAEINALLRDLRHILNINDEREFMRILRKYGIKDEDPRFSEIVKLFRALRSGRT